MNGSPQFRDVGLVVRHPPGEMETRGLFNHNVMDVINVVMFYLVLIINECLPGDGNDLLS